jgi:hypothetical protein
MNKVESCNSKKIPAAKERKGHRDKILCCFFFAIFAIFCGQFVFGCGSAQLCSFAVIPIVFLGSCLAWPARKPDDAARNGPPNLWGWAVGAAFPTCPDVGETRRICQVRTDTGASAWGTEKAYQVRTDTGTQLHQAPPVNKICNRMPIVQQ